MQRIELNLETGEQTIVQLTPEEIAANEVSYLTARQDAQAAFDALPYTEKRASEYPPMSDYLDGIVKGDQAQIDKYIADCLAVKAKYPKPE